MEIRIVSKYKHENCTLSLTVVFLFKSSLVITVNQKTANDKQ